MSILHVSIEYIYFKGESNRILTLSVFQKPSPIVLPTD